ncbi:MAG: PadR family transcriptional regulator [Gemmatimonadaceae bacterium]
MLGSDGAMLRGTLDVLILKALCWGPRHGYAIAEWVKTITETEILVEEGPLYTALHRLERDGWLIAEWGVSENNRKAKFYSLSKSGKRQLVSETSAWARYAKAVSKALSASTPLGVNA